MYYRWVVNLFLVGLPYLLVAVLLNLYNIWFNIYMNDWWAEGNIYLVTNSIYSMLQTQISLIVVFEVPLFLEHLKLLRLFSFTLAIIYNIIYIAFAVETNKLFKLEEFTKADVLLVFFLVYNLVMNGGNVILSGAIIAKEISLEFLQMGNDAVGGDGDYSLGLTDIWMFWRGVWWVLNPLNWFDMIYYLIYSGDK